MQLTSYNAQYSLCAKNYLVPNVTSATDEKPWPGGGRIQLPERIANLKFTSERRHSA